MSKEWFSRKAITLTSEKVNLKTRTMADGTLNTHRILTDLDIITPTVIYNEGIVSSLPHLTSTLNIASSTALSFSPIPSTPTPGGVSQPSPGTIRVTKKGNYKFLLQFGAPDACRLRCDMLLDGGPYDARIVELPEPFVGLDLGAAFTFFYNQSVDATHNFTFTARAGAIADDANVAGVTHAILVSFDGHS